MDRRQFIRACAAGALAVAGGRERCAADEQRPGTRPARSDPYILGADVSWLLEDEADGATYWDRGVQKDLLDILKSYQFNSIRARLFVNPAAPGGYSARRGPYCDLEHTKKLATRVKAAGMQFLLDFHYADTWTSPGKQSKPAAWADFTFDQLTRAVHDWTRTALLALKENQTPPQLVQIGNETTDGILFPEGRKSNFDRFAALVNAGCQAVREFDPAIRIALHNHLGRDNETIRAWVDNFLQCKTDFDIIGMSCYSESKPGDLRKNFEDIAVRYPQLSFLALEYSYRKRYLNDLIYDAPNGKGLGSFIWEPTRWREAIFDKDGQNAGDDDKNKPHLPASTLPPLSPRPLAEAPVAPATQPAGPARRGRFSRSGRYETNSYILEYPEMAKAYGLSH